MCVHECVSTCRCVLVCACIFLHVAAYVCAHLHVPVLMCTRVLDLQRWPDSSREWLSQSRSGAPRSIEEWDSSILLLFCPYWVLVGLPRGIFRACVPQLRGLRSVWVFRWDSATGWKWFN